MTHSSPNAVSSSSDSLYELAEELTQRLQRGDSLDVPALLAAHPQHAEQLQQILPAIEILADLQGSNCADAGGPARSASHTVDGVLGDFRIHCEIGRGGMGVVYEAQQISLDRRVALKVLPFAGVLDARQLQRFTNEARAAAGLHHPNIVPVYAVGCERGVHYYAMQYIDGQTLADVIRDLRRSALPPLARGGKGGARSMQDVVEEVERVEESKGRTNDENSKSNEIRDPKSEITAPPSSILDLPSSTPSDAVMHQCSGTHQETYVSRSPGASTLRPFDSSTPSTLAPRLIAEWGIQIAEGLDYAHSVGVVHRDIKPANLMLDAQGRVWITDFGLAQIETDAGLTMTGDIVGTLRYMSPEQALGERGLVDQRTDVYSLGLTLYELLTRQPAFGAGNRRELLHRISNEDPIAPRRINSSIPVELETIVQKAIEKDAAARYTTARDLADDLRRFLQEQPIKARPATVLDRLRKWSMRNRVFVRTSMAFTLLAIMFLVAAGIWLDHERQQSRLERQAHETDRKIAASAHNDLRIHRYVTKINVAERAWNNGEFAEARRQLQDCVPSTGEEDCRSFEWRYLAHVTSDVAPLFGDHLGSVYCFRLSPDGRTAASGGQDGARIWDYQTGVQIDHLRAHGDDVNSVEFLRDGRLLATGGDDQSAKIWDTSNWQLLYSIPHVGNVVACMFTPDGKILATAERKYRDSSTKQDVGDNIVRLWSVGSWASLGDLRASIDSMHSLAISDDGTLLATGSEGVACVWDLNARKLLRELPQTAQCVAFAHHRRMLVTVAGESINLWRIADGALEASLNNAVRRPDCVAISGDDSTIVAAGSRGQIPIWELKPNGKYAVNSVLRTAPAIWSTTFIDDTAIVTTDRDWGAVRRRDRLKTPERRRIQFPGADVPDFAISPDGRFLVAGSCQLHVYDLATQSDALQLPLSGSCAISVAFSPDGNSLVTGHESGEIVIYDPKNWRAAQVLPRHPSRVYDVQYVPGGKLLAINSKQTYIDLAQKRVIAWPFPESAPGDWVAFGPGGRGIAVARDLMVQTWDGTRKLRAFRVPGFVPISAVSQDGLRFAHSLIDGTIRIWNLDDDRPELMFVGDPGEINHLTFSADGRTLAGMALRDGSIRFWNVATGQQLLSLETGLAVVKTLMMTPDGNTLAASGMSIADRPELNVWQTRSGE